MTAVSEYVARQTVRMAEALAHFIATTPEEKLNWQLPCEGSDPTRSALQLVSECVQVNHLVAAVLRHEKPAMPQNREDIVFANSQDAQHQLIESAKVLAQAIAALSEADLQTEFSHPRGPMRGENLILSCYRNMAYHAGQINFIQTLYGDKEFHVPPNWR